MLLRRDGTELPVELRVVPVLGTQGAVLGAVLVIRNAFERRWLEAERTLLLEREHAAQREAHAQRGSIRVRSQPGEGATFIVRLPLDPAASAVA